ncbi:MAG: hypothetical protein WAV43_04690 [Streptococcus parauberis]
MADIETIRNTYDNYTLVTTKILKPGGATSITYTIQKSGYSSKNISQDKAKTANYYIDNGRNAAESLRRSSDISAVEKATNKNYLSLIEYVANVLKKSNITKQDLIDLLKTLCGFIPVPDGFYFGDLATAAANKHNLNVLYNNA